MSDSERESAPSLRQVPTEALAAELGEAQRGLEREREAARRRPSEWEWCRKRIVGTTTRSRPPWPAPFDRRV